MQQVQIESQMGATGFFDERDQGDEPMIRGDEQHPVSAEQQGPADAAGASITQCRPVRLGKEGRSEFSAAANQRTKSPRAIRHVEVAEGGLTDPWNSQHEELPGNGIQIATHRRVDGKVENPRAIAIRLGADQP
ncbi:hypothetical protein FQZ97_958850 [compost metagenome]